MSNGIEHWVSHRMQIESHAPRSVECGMSGSGSESISSSFPVVELANRDLFRVVFLFMGK